jgi:hypothetical protein
MRMMICPGGAEASFILSVTGVSAFQNAGSTGQTASWGGKT